MMSKLHESMTRISLAKYTIRVWRQEEPGFEPQPGLYSDVEQVARANEELSAAMLAEKLSELPRINAVEVLNWDLSGVVIYNDWP